MADYDSSLPVRTENDGDVIAKIADGTTPAQQWEILATKEGVVTIREGGNVLSVNPDGSINANLVQAVTATEKHIYDTASAVAVNTPTDVVDYTVTAATTFILKSWKVAASGKAKYEVKVGPTGSEVTVDVGFLSTATGTDQVTLPSPIEVVAGDKILVTMTNIDKGAQDLYAFVNGNEV